ETNHYRFMMGQSTSSHRRQLIGSLLKSWGSRRKWIGACKKSMRAAFFVGEEAYDLTKVVDPVWQGGASQGHIKSRESAPVQEPVKPCLVYVEAHALSTVVDSIDLSQP